jgi:hypothetical protein
VGYVNVTVARNSWNLLANPLKNGNNTLNEILPAGAGDAALVATLDPTIGAIGAIAPDTDNFIEGAGWFNSGTGALSTKQYPPGTGFLLLVDSAAANASYTLTFVGEVSQGNNLSHPVATGGRYSFQASEVPQAGPITTVLRLTPADGDIVAKFDSSVPTPGASTLGAYNPNTFTYIDPAGWFDSVGPAEPSLGVAEAVLFNRSAAAPTAWTRCFNVNTPCP